MYFFVYTYILFAVVFFSLTIYYLHLFLVTNQFCILLQYTWLVNTKYNAN